MKVILTNHNNILDTDVKFLSYWQTSFNEGIQPGDFIWAPGTTPTLSAQNAPWRSPQIFSEYLDDESILAATETIPGTNLTSAVFAATTLENKAFGVKAGQRVEIILFQINSNLPTFLLAKSSLEIQAQEFAALVSDIATSDELVDRISAFLDD